MEIFSKGEVALLSSEAYGIKFRPVYDKKVFFEAITKENRRIVLCSPQSKYHKNIEAWWSDITEIQYDFMEKYDEAIIIFRLEGSMLCMLNWLDFKAYLNEECRRYNTHEKEHWKLYVHREYIKISGNNNKFNVKITKHLI